MIFSMILIFITTLVFSKFLCFQTRQRSFIKHFQKEQMKKILILLILSVTTLISQENIKYSETITSKDLYKHISVLSDSLEGRETAKKDKNARLYNESFQRHRIPPYKNNRYYQKFRVKRKTFIEM